MNYREPTLELPSLPSHQASHARLDTAEQDIRAMLANYKESGQITNLDKPKFDFENANPHTMAKFKVSDVNIKMVTLAMLGAVLLICTGFLLGQLV